MGSDTALAEGLEVVAQLPEPTAPPKRKRPSRKKVDDGAGEIVDTTEAGDVAATPEIAEETPVAPAKPARAKRTPKAKAGAANEAPIEATIEAVDAVAHSPAVSAEVLSSENVDASPPQGDTAEGGASSESTGPKRSGWWSRNAKKLFGS